MAPPDGSGPRRLPTLSWDSIVDDGDPTTDAPGTSEAPAGAEVPPSGASGTPTPAGTEADVPPPDVRAPDIVPVPPLTLGTVPPAAPPDAPVPPETQAAPPAASAPPAPVAPPPAAATDEAPVVAEPAAVAEPVAEPAAVAEPLVVTAPEPAVAEPAARAEPAVVDEPHETEVGAATPVAAPGVADAAPSPSMEVRSTPPQPVVAPIGPVAEPAPAAVSTELPQIREATPVPELEPSSDVDRTGVVPTVDGADVTPEYRLPTVPQPDQTRVAPPPEVDPYETVLPRRSTSRTRSRSGLKLLLILVVLGGLVAAGIVFGRPYLFPEDWDAAAEPYAATVEEVTGAEYTDTFLLVAEPTAAYTDRMSNVLVGDWTADAPQWRALGLVTGEANAENVTLLLEGWHHAVHDPGDGQVYRDAALDGTQVDAEVTRAFASVLLDQQYGWSERQAERTLDDAVWTQAEVHRQAAATQAASQFPAAVEPRATAALSFLPPVLAYEVLAPATFAAFERTDLPDPSSGADNPLRGLGVGGPGPLAPDAPVAAAPPVALDGDTISGSPVAVDRSFWYLVLAGYLDTRTAYEASEAIVESSMTTAERVANRCVYATFSGGDVQQTATLRTALETWAATVPLEMSASFTVLADGTLQLTTCDPGSRFENGSRIGVGRELIGWRMAETATTLAVTAAGGSAEDAAAAWTVVEATNVPVELANLPFDTVPAEAAATAVEAVAGVLPPTGD